MGNRRARQRTLLGIQREACALVEDVFRAVNVPLRHRLVASVCKQPLHGFGNVAWSWRSVRVDLPMAQQAARHEGQLRITRIESMGANASSRVNPSQCYWLTVPRSIAGGHESASWEDGVDVKVGLALNKRSGKDGGSACSNFETSVNALTCRKPKQYGSSYIV